MNRLQEAALLIREYRDDEWDSIWPIFKDIIRAQETFAYDPAWTSEQARDVWIGQPPSRTLVACLGPRLVGTATLGRQSSWPRSARVYRELHGGRTGPWAGGWGSAGRGCRVCGRWRPPVARSYPVTALAVSCPATSLPTNSSTYFWSEIVP